MQVQFCEHLRADDRDKMRRVLEIPAVASDKALDCVRYIPGSSSQNSLLAIWTLTGVHIWFSQYL